jgi:hypothetical protein
MRLPDDFRIRRREFRDSVTTAIVAVDPELSLLTLESPLAVAVSTFRGRHTLGYQGTDEEFVAIANSRYTNSGVNSR